MFTSFILHIHPHTLSIHILHGFFAKFLSCSMENHTIFFAFCLLVFYFLQVSQGVTKADEHVHPTKLFVFGDSYADTGNRNKSEGSSWTVPYGITFPGKPSGRYSDGRVLTDYIARFLGIKTPIAYAFRKYVVKQLRYGMNFAYGGTGVFDTLISYPNMTTQINFFQDLINESVYTKQDLNTSLVLVTVSGNDYGSYFTRGGSNQGLPNFTSLLINQLALDLKRIGDMGVRKVVVTNLEPLGCLPQSTMQYSYKKCDTTANAASNIHNFLLQQAVAKLNNETESTHFVILDIYSSFLTVLENKGHSIGGPKFETPLKPCCMGTNSTYFCGSLDGNGNKLYTLCSDPDSAIFWDIVHPSNAGWRAVYLSLRSTLQKLII